MNITELMVGDWIYDSKYDKFEIVKGIKPFGVSTNETHHIMKEEVKPVPITQKILEINGFDYWKVYGSCDDTQRKTYALQDDNAENGYLITVEFSPNLIMLSINTCGERPEYKTFFGAVKFVHEIQHALRMCHISKELKVIQEECLMDNDWVLINGNPIQISSSTVESKPNDSVPIPITKEILEKNKFKIWKEGEYYLDISDNEKWKNCEFWYNFPNNSLYMHREDKLHDEHWSSEGLHFNGVMLVHELQHIFNVCKIAKDIVL